MSRSSMSGISTPNPKSQITKPKQIPNPKPQIQNPLHSRWAFEIWHLVFVCDLWFVIWDLPPVLFLAPEDVRRERVGAGLAFLRSVDADDRGVTRFDATTGHLGHRAIA